MSESNNPTVAAQKPEDASRLQRRNARRCCETAEFVGRNNTNSLTRPRCFAANESQNFALFADWAALLDSREPKEEPAVNRANEAHFQWGGRLTHFKLFYGLKCCFTNRIFVYAERIARQTSALSQVDKKYWGGCRPSGSAKGQAVYPQPFSLSSSHFNLHFL